MATWPATLPQQFEQGAQETRQSGLLRSAVDIGPPKQRRRFSAVSRFYAGTFLFTTAQKATFETFYSTTIAEGADEFDFEDPNDGGTVSARFTGPPSFSALLGGPSGVTFWRMSAEIEVLP